LIKYETFVALQPPGQASHSAAMVLVRALGDAVHAECILIAWRAIVAFGRKPVGAVSGNASAQVFVESQPSCLVAIASARAREVICPCAAGISAFCCPSLDCLVVGPAGARARGQIPHKSRLSAFACPVVVNGPQIGRRRTDAAFAQPITAGPSAFRPRIRYADIDPVADYLAFGAGFASFGGLP